MVVRIRAHTFLKPRRCPQCHKLCLFARAPKAKCCPKCHKEQRKISRRANRRFKRREGTYKYSAKYHTMRKKLLAAQAYCSLCGTTENLTIHHVGGGSDHYTVLCESCHQAYERYNHKRKAKVCTRKNGIEKITRSVKRAWLGIKLAVLLKRTSLENLRPRIENLMQG